MSLTRASVESVLIRRCGRLLTAAGLDGTTGSGSNADLVDPISWAVRQLGLAVATLGSLSDSDLAGVATDDLDALLDLAELRCYESALGNLDVVDVSVGPERESLGQLGTRLESLIERKRAAIQRTHGIGAATLTGGTIRLGFQQRTPPEI